jgi:hypothetical protein
MLVLLGRRQVSHASLSVSNHGVPSAQKGQVANEREGLVALGVLSTITVQFTVYVV